MVDFISNSTVVPEEGGVFEVVITITGGVSEVPVTLTVTTTSKTATNGELGMDYISYSQGTRMVARV